MLNKPVLNYISILVFGVLVYVLQFINARIDLTAENKFSLSKSTIQILQQIEEPLQIEVLLTGNLTADYQKLKNATADILEEFAAINKQNITVSFNRPDENVKDDSLKFQLYDSLAKLGVVFERTSVENKNEQISQFVIPAALVSVAGKKPIAIDLRSSRKIYKQYNVIEDVAPQEDVEATRNAAESLLEFKFANAIDKLTRKTIPTIAYVIGNGQPVDLTVNDLGQSIRNEYRLGIFNLKEAYPDAKTIDALIIVKPTIPFTDEDKLKLDQYVMNGGKIIWFIDKLHAELDSLMRTQGEYTAYDRNLDIDDLLFKYGVKINGDLLQDLNCSKIPLVIGKNENGSPRFQRVPWPYYPLLSTTNNNPISKNLDKVLPVFPSTLDTLVNAPGITKTVLLASDSTSRIISTPAIVSVNSVQSENDLASFRKSFLPVAVLLEGKFTSLFVNRISKAVKDSIKKVSGKDFLAKAIKNSQQIVVSDADIVTNAVTSTGPLEMGTLPFENYRFANREFFLNALDYLVNTNNLFESRNKDFQLRLLNKQKVADQQLLWQLINVLFPVLIIFGLGFIAITIRKKRYTN
ncbi:MAG: gliding motility-associated ABC transporter substrate-binding protein GldG [Chitinophagaceae bacterium]